MVRHRPCNADLVGSIPITGSMEDDKILDALEGAAEETQKRKSLEDLMGGLETRVELIYGKNEGDGGRFGHYPEVTMILHFAEKGFGFGEVAIKKHPKGVFVDTEHMSLKRVKKYLSMLVDGAITDTDSEPEKHRLYNEVMGRGCGLGCPVCSPGETAGE